MARQIIGVGTGPDTHTGEPLRTAWIKTNENFAELYATTANLANLSANTGNIVFSAQTISGQLANTNITIQPLGAGQVNIVGNLTTSQLRFMGNTISTQFDGDLVLESSAGNIKLNDPIKFSDGTVQYSAAVGNAGTVNTLTITNLSSSNTTATSATIANLTGTTATYTTYRFANGNSILANISTVGFTGSYADLTNKPTIPTHTGNLTNDSGYITSAYVTWSNVSAKPTFATVATSGSYPDLLNRPSFANVSTTGDYGDLLNKPNLSVYATTTYVDSALSNLVANAPSTLDTLREITDSLGNLTSIVDYVDNTVANVNNIGNISFDDYNIYNAAGQGVIISNFSFVEEAETAYVQIPAGNSSNDLNVVQEQGNVRLVANAAVWNFDTAGNLTAPGTITANIITATESADLGSLNFYASVISMNDDVWDNIFISPNGESYAYLSVPKNSVANVQDVRLHNDAGNIELGTSGGINQWLFDNAGDLNLPNNGNLKFNGGGIQQVLNEDFYVRVSDDEGDGWSIYNTVDDGSGTDLTQTRIDSDGFYIQTDMSSSNYQWNFNGYQGITNFPGNLQGVYGGDTSFYAYDNGSGGMVEMKTISYIGDQLLANVTVRHPNVTISTQNSAYTWTFDGTGNLVLPPSGNIVGDTANNSGHLSWFGNSSGDGNGYTTMRLVPDDTVEGNDQYLIIDPTAPGHIHIRAGGTQDNSGAELILGGENSHFRVDNGPNPDVYVTANSKVWTFYGDGNLIIPNSIHGTNSGSPIVIDAGGSTGGYSYVSIPSFTDGGEQLVIKNAYNSSQGIRLQTESGNFTFSGTSITFPDSTTQTTAFTGSVDTGNITFTNEVISVDSGLDLDIKGSSDNLGVYIYAHGTDGLANGAAEIDITANGVTVYSAYGENSPGSPNVKWVFDQTGNLTLPSNVANINYSNGTSILSGISSTSSYGNSNVVTLLSSLGSNAVSTTGNITSGNLLASGYANITGNINGSGATFSGNVTAANLSGNISITGNVTGTSSNVTLVAGSYSTTFDNTGNTTLANGTVTMTNLVASGTTSFGNTSTVTTANYQIGYRDIPQVTFSSNATAALTDASKHFYSTTAGNLQLTIPDNANVAFPTGATLTVVVNAAGNVIVAQGTGVSLYMAGSSTTGNRTVGAYGLASVMKVATNTWVISGTGVY